MVAARVKTEPNTPPRPEANPSVRVAYLAATIPAVLLLSPLVGGFLGHWIGGLFGHSRPGTLIGGAMGFLAGVMETINLLRRITRELK